MDGFASQLADLQRSASRAGRGTTTGVGGGDGGNRRPPRDGGRGRGSGGGGSRDGGCGGGGGGAGYRVNWRGGGGGGGRKRDREDHRGNDRGDQHHRRGGRRDPRDEGGAAVDDGLQPLSTLVERVAERYGGDVAGKDANNSGGGGTAATRPRRRRRRRHIALLFLTIDDLPHEHIWREWMRPVDDDDDGDDGVIVSVLCHAKHPDRIRSPWLRRRHLLRRGDRESSSSSSTAGGGDGGRGGGDSNTSYPPFHTRRPEWGSVDIAKAMMDLLEEGLRIGTGGSSSEEDDGRDDGYRRYLSTTPPKSAVGTDATRGDDVPSSPAVDGPERPDDDDDGDDDDACVLPPVDRFVYVSESCLPVTTLKECAMALFGPKMTTTRSSSREGEEDDDDGDDDDPRYGKSWVRARSTPNNGYAKQLQWDAMRECDVPARYVWKADQWVALTRTHAQAISSLTNGRYLDGNRTLWHAYRDVRASDEIYVPTALSILGVIRRPSGGGEVGDDDDDVHTPGGGGARRRPDGENSAGPGIRRRRVTYCDWGSGARNPTSFGPAEWGRVASAARGEGCLFARKFVPGGGGVGSAPSSRPPYAPEKNGEAGAGNGLISVEEWKSAVTSPS